MSSFDDAPTPARGLASPPRDPGDVRLLALLENATEGSRELDAQAWASILPRDGKGLDGYGLPAGAHYEYSTDEAGEGRVACFVVFESAPSTHHMRCWREAPPYTTSLDAALSLLPTGWRWVCGWRGAARYYAEIASADNDHDGRAMADTAPLAMCIAYFRARATQDGGR